MIQVTGLPLLSDWHNFYIIIGTAAATLTGLMFVVITLIAGIDTHVATLNPRKSTLTAPTKLLCHPGCKSLSDYRFG